MARIGEQKIAMRTRDMKTNKIARYQIISKNHILSDEEKWDRRKTRDGY